MSIKNITDDNRFKELSGIIQNFLKKHPTLDCVLVVGERDSVDGDYNIGSTSNMPRQKSANMLLAHAGKISSGLLVAGDINND